MTTLDEQERLNDHMYGMRSVEVTCRQWMIGNTVYDIYEDDSFYIGWKRYKGTSVIYELIFMKYPDENVYNENDLAGYRSILEETNAHKHGTLPGVRIKTSKGYKYKEIISQLFPSCRCGVVYVHSDDPKELVERLRLLLVSL